MGERKGQNFYYPPDFDYKKHKTLNQYHGTHALRERAAKIKQGILIIRFEMPFNVWCMGCHNHVGMGVRYNAEKKKVGMYYTTPVYEFRMRCHLCDNYFVIRTDPEHFDYELVEGLHRQEKRYDPSTIDQLGAVDRGFSRLLEGDKMLKAEHEEQDSKKSVDSEKQIDKLEWIQERMKDDFAANQVLRAAFRREKTDLKEQRAKDEDLLKRMSLDMKLIPENPDDKKLASIISRYKIIDKTEKQRATLLKRPIFDTERNLSKRRANVSCLGKEILVSNLQGRSNDAFGSSPSTSQQPQSSSIGVVIRKKREGEHMEGPPQVKEEIHDETKCEQPFESTELVGSYERKETKDCKLLSSSLCLVADYSCENSSSDSEHG